MHWVALVTASWTSWGEWSWQLPSASRASVTGWWRGRKWNAGLRLNSLWRGGRLICWNFSTYTQYKYSSLVFGNVSHCYCTEAHKTLNCSMHANKNFFFLALKWTKLLPLSIFYVEKRHTVLFVPSCPLSQALFSACEGLLQISCVVRAALLSEA